MAQPYQQSYLASRAARRPDLEVALGDTMSGGDGPILPPCRVCGDKASGFHYGAITCEACKNFFRRSLQRTGEYRCRGSGKCEILLGERRFCSACRLAKCQALGMSKKAIKTGRYTLEKHAENIEEVKRLRMQEEMRKRSAQINASLNAKLQGFRPITDNMQFSSNPNIRSENLLSPNRSRPTSPSSLSDSAVPYGLPSGHSSNNSSAYNSPCPTPSHELNRNNPMASFSYSSPNSPTKPYDPSRRASYQGYMNSPQICVTTVSDEQLVPTFGQVTDSKFTQYQFNYSPYNSTHTSPSHSPIPEPNEYYSSNQSSPANIYTATDSVLNGDPMLSAMQPMDTNITYSNGKVYQNLGQYQHPVPNAMEGNMKDRINAMTIDDTRYNMQQTMLSGTNQQTSPNYAQDTKYTLGEQPNHGQTLPPAGIAQPNAQYPTSSVKVEQWMESTNLSQPLGQPPPYPYTTRTDTETFAQTMPLMTDSKGSGVTYGTMGQQQTTPYLDPPFKAMASLLDAKPNAPQADYPSNTSSYESFPQQNSGNNPYPSEQIPPSVKSEGILEIPESMESLSPEKIKEMEETIATLTAAYNSAPPFVPEGLEDLAEKERKFMAEKSEKESLFGPMNPVAHEEYAMIYSTTGIDVDGRREIAKHHMPSIEASIRNYIRIAKFIPGFNDLPVSDRSYLIKRSLFDCWTLSAHRSVNVKESLYTNQQGQTMHRIDMEKVHNKPIIEEFFRQAEFLQGMQMTPTEIVLLIAIAMFISTSTEKLQDGMAAARIFRNQEFILEYHLNKTRPDEPTRFRNLEDYIRRRQEFKQQNQVRTNLLSIPDITFPELLGEIIEGSRSALP